MSKICIASLLAMTLAGCSNTQPEHQVYQPNLPHGEAVYKGQCQSCHEAGKRNAPSITDAEDWDLQTLSAPGVVQQHLAMNLLEGQGRRAQLTQYDESDVLFYIRNAVGEGDSKY